MFTRLLFGLFGILIGALVVWSAVLRDLRAMEINHQWPAQYWMDVLGAPLLAAALIAFGAAQWLQVIWIGDDAEFNPAHWQQISQAERKRHSFRRDLSRNYSILLWLALSAILLGVINFNMARGVVEGSLPLGDLATPAAFNIAAIAGLLVSGRNVLRTWRKAAGDEIAPDVT
jgi:hypothetical protein